MVTHDALDKAGEDAAATYLERSGYAIRHRNWRKNHLEPSIVAAKDNEVVIVEIKTWSNTQYIESQDAVDRRKIRRTVATADAYMKHFCIDASVCFNIITVVDDTGTFKIGHVKETFYPPVS